MEIYVKFLLLLFPYFFLIFKHNFIRCVDFTRILASNTARVMTSQIRSHIDYLIQTYIISSCTRFLVEIDEKSNHNGGFKYDLMMISDSGLLFGPPCKLILNFIRMT